MREHCQKERENIHGEQHAPSAITAQRRQRPPKRPSASRARVIHKPFKELNSTFVIVLGMHRSGTSVITHILTEAGFFSGEDSELIPGNQWNRRGYFERRSVMQVNEFILNLCNGSWHGPPLEDDLVRIDIDAKLERVLEAYRGHEGSVMKDPRLCLTLPVWRRVLNEKVLIIIIRREPDAVAASLERRNGFSRQKSLLLWETYNERASRYARMYSHFSLYYEELFSERRKEVFDRLSVFVRAKENLEDIAARVVDPSLRHDERMSERVAKVNPHTPTARECHQHGDAALRHEGRIVSIEKEATRAGEKEMSKARRWWDYGKFRQNSVRVMLVSLRHLLVRELSGALRRLGHHCNVLMISDAEMDRRSIEETFSTAIRTFRPDFVLTVNHLGFDHEGTVTGLLTGYHIPFASWYVDSPHLIIRHYAKNTSPYLTVFLWDKDYITIARDLGFERVEYLPLGVDENLFHPLNTDENPLAHLACGVSFVGNSMQIKVKSVLDRNSINGALREKFEEVSCAFRRSDHLVVRNMMENLFPELSAELLQLPGSQALGYEAGVTWQATGWYRLEMVEKLEIFRPLIVGDRGWKMILNTGYRLHGELSYYRDLPWFYNVTRVSFNATSRQMKNGVNQRVFDVPACKSVVVTDWTRQLENLMEPNRDVLAYRSADEIPEVVSRALHDRDCRNHIAASGYRRVLTEHTYCHRAQRIVRVMRTHYG